MHVSGVEQDHGPHNCTHGWSQDATRFSVPKIPFNSIRFGVCHRTLQHGFHVFEICQSCPRTDTSCCYILTRRQTASTFLASRRNVLFPTSYEPRDFCRAFTRTLPRIPISGPVTFDAHINGSLDIFDRCCFSFSFVDIKSNSTQSSGKPTSVMNTTGFACVLCFMHWRHGSGHMHNKKGCCDANQNYGVVNCEAWESELKINNKNRPMCLKNTTSPLRSKQKYVRPSVCPA